MAFVSAPYATLLIETPRLSTVASKTSRHRRYVWVVSLTPDVPMQLRSPGARQASYEVRMSDEELKGLAVQPRR